MWKTLHQLAMPPRLYQICGWFIPWLAIASAVVLITGLIWGFGFAPADYQQGQSYRIIYLHVPAAIWSMGIYASMAVAAFIGLVWQMKMANLALAAMAPIGAVFTFIALVTALHGANRCGAPGGSGMPDSPLNWCCCFSTLAPLRCGMPLTTAVWLVALPAFWC